MERLTGTLESGLEQFADDGKRAENFIKIVRRYTDFDELTPSMLNEYIDKIIVHEAEGFIKEGYGRNNSRTQKVEIYLNFIGKFEVPGHEEAEPKPFDPVEHKRAIGRKHYHRHREELRAKQKARYAEKKAAKLAALPVKTPEELKAEKEAEYQKHREYQHNYQREWHRKRKLAAMEAAEKGTA